MRSVVDSFTHRGSPVDLCDKTMFWELFGVNEDSCIDTITDYSSIQADIDKNKVSCYLNILVLLIVFNVLLCAFFIR